MENKRLGVVAIIHNEIGEVLLLNRNFLPLGLCLPGGRVEEGEHLKDAVVREVFEEIGISTEPTDYRFHKEALSVSGRRIFVYHCHQIVEREFIRLSPEHNDFRFERIETLPEPMFFSGNTLEFLGVWDKTKEITKAQALGAMKDGYKVRHEYYSPEEYTFINKYGEFETEDGCVHGGIFDEFWAIYQKWETGWWII